MSDFLSSISPAPHFGNVIVKVENVRDRREKLQKSLNQPGLKANLVSTREVHVHGNYDLIEIKTKQNSAVREALKPLMKNDGYGLILNLYSDSQDGR